MQRNAHYFITLTFCYGRHYDVTQLLLLLWPAELEHSAYKQTDCLLLWLGKMSKWSCTSNANAWYIILFVFLLFLSTLLSCYDCCQILMAM